MINEYLRRFPAAVMGGSRAALLIIAAAIISVLFVAVPAGAVNLSELEVYKSGIEPKGLVFSPDGESLIVYGAKGKVTVWNTRTKKERYFQTNEGDINGIAVDPDQRHLAAALSSGNVVVWDFDTGQQVNLLKHKKNGVYAVAYSPVGDILASGDYDGVIYLWSIGNGALLSTIEGHKKKVHTLLFNRGGNQVLSGSEDNTIRIWDVNTRKEKRAIMETASQYGELRTITFSQDYSLIALGLTVVKRDTRNRRTAAGAPSWSFVVKVRDGTTGEELGDLDNHLQEINAIAISADNGLMASVSNDETVRLWDVAQMRQITNLPLAEKGRAVAFSPETDRLATANIKGDVKLFQISGHKTKETAAAAPAHGMMETKTAKKERVVMMKLRGGIATEQLTAYRAALVEGLSANYEVLSGDDVDKKTMEIFKRESAKGGECNTCYQELTREFGAGLLAIGTLTKKDDQTLITFQLVNAIEGRVAASASETCESCNDFQLMKRLRQIGRKAGH
ncbi:MAG: WD40 repeat domain-containing protein [Nitrospinae bacterium]|nr:WD40 repeat domain-containing protein [Nitrospinota bacterium]